MDQHDDELGRKERKIKLLSEETNLRHILVLQGASTKFGSHVVPSPCLYLVVTPVDTSYLI